MSFYEIFYQLLKFSMPLLIVALGGMFSERSGVVNIALDGIMIFGAFVSIVFINLVQGMAEPFLTGQWLFIVAMLISAISGMLLSATHAYAAINMKADQTISGTAINMFAPAVAIFVARTISPNDIQQVPFKNEFMIQKVPVLGDIPVLGDLLFKKCYISTFVCIVILIVAAFVLYKTRYGLRLRACGEHPQAADSVGINVYKVRWSGVLISGALAGLGGLIFIIPTTVEFNATVSGYGFLAIAVLIFGQWKPYKILLAALFFGFMKSIGSTYQGISFLQNLGLHANIYKMIPYVATLVTLAFTSKSSQAPSASGVPYDKGSR